MDIRKRLFGKASSDDEKKMRRIVTNVVKSAPSVYTKGQLKGLCRVSFMQTYDKSYPEDDLDGLDKLITEELRKQGRPS